MPADNQALSASTSRTKIVAVKLTLEEWQAWKIASVERDLPLYQWVKWVINGRIRADQEARRQAESAELARQRVLEESMRGAETTLRKLS